MTLPATDRCPDCAIATSAPVDTAQMLADGQLVPANGFDTSVPFDAARRRLHEVIGHSAGVATWYGRAETGEWAAVVGRVLLLVGLDDRVHTYDGAARSPRPGPRFSPARLKVHAELPGCGTCDCHTRFTSVLTVDDLLWVALGCQPARPVECVCD